MEHMPNELQTGRKLNLIVISAAIGSMLEWYDFAIYVFLAPIIAELFFPATNPYISLMSAYAVFGLGYLVRPFGAVYFGHLGDRFGRQKILVFTIILMSVPTFLIGLLPTHSAIGIAAPILLLLLRVVQGLSTDGERMGSVTFVFESSPPRLRGFTTSIIWMASGFGFLLGSVGIALLTVGITKTQLLAWAWRIPFFFAIFTGLIAYLIRIRTGETPYFKAMVKRGEQLDKPFLEVLKKHKMKLAVIFFLFIPAAVVFYIIFVFAPNFVYQFFGQDIHMAMAVNSFSLLILLLFTPVFGYLSDRFGRKRFMIFALIAYLPCSVSLFSLLTSGSLLSMFIAQASFAFLDAMYTGPLMAIALEQVQTRIRYTTVSAGNNFAYSIFGGTGPFVVTYLIHNTRSVVAPAFYIIAVAIVVLPVIIKMKERHKEIVM